jgi:hypothetical protein
MALSRCAHSHWAAEAGNGRDHPCPFRDRPMKQGSLASFAISIAER